MEYILAARLILVCFFFAFIVSVKGGFIFTAPKIFFSGYDENVCITFTNQSDTAIVKVTILEQKNDVEITSALTEISEKEKNDKCFKISMPRIKTTKGRLRLSINFKTDGNFNNNYMEQILIQTNPDITFIETDKPIYTSGQLLKFRIFTLKPDLRPVTESVDKIWIETPSGIRVKQWLNVSTIQGFINKTFQLSNESMPGKWIIKLKREEEVIAKNFLVEDYVLPKFSIKILAPDYISSSENITICANYVFGEPVQGNLILNFFVRCSFSFYCQEKESSIIENLRLNKTGCKEYKITLKNLSLFSQFLVINATVIENGTQFKAQALAKITIKNLKQKNLPDFASEMKKKKFKPALPFKGEVIWKREPKSNDMVTICLNTNELQSCKELYVFDNKTKFVIMPFPIKDKKNFKISVEVSNSRDNLQKGSHTTKINLVPWYSPSNSYIQLENLSHRRLSCKEEITFNVLYSATDSEIQFHYMIKARGSILTKGLLNEFSDKAKQFNLEADENQINYGEIKNVMQFQFKIRISSIMAPYSYLIVYFIRNDGEIVADNLIFEVEKCLPNEVKSSWEKQEVAPGSFNKLIIESPSSSICALTVSDKSLKLLSPKLNFKIDKVFQEVEKLELKPILFDNDSKHCKNKAVNIINATDKMEALSEFKEMDSQFIDTFQAFSDFGVLVITDLVFETRPCRESKLGNEGPINTTTKNSKINFNDKEIENIKLFKDEDFLNEADNLNENRHSLRTFFPETWIWDFIQMNDSSSTTLSFKVPHTITEWVAELICLSKEKGLGIAEQSNFITYQPFFLDFHVPHSLKRKEIFHLLVTVFNFEKNYLPVKVTFLSLASFSSKSEEHKFYCIKPRSKIVHRFILEALKLGQTEIKIKAEVNTNFERSCGNVSLSKSDLMVKKLLVTHEGFPMEEVKSGFICSGNSNFTSEVTWSIKIPLEAVESSVSINALVSGDILGPPLKNIEKLISLPTGCGEQNMIHLVPNILLLDYLLYTSSKDLESIEKALKNLDLGYQRQLNYKLRDGSYSAFGEKDEKGSIWLTAFVIRYLSQAKKYIYIDEQDLNVSVAWILKQQLENGCFPLIGKIYHRKIQEKLIDEESSKTVTAYILISLIEAGVTIDNRIIKNAIYCLKSNEESLGLYGDLVSSYALILAGHYREAQASMMALMKEAKRSYGLLWWESEDSIESAVEMTSYGILTLLKLGGPHFLAAASDAIRWILQFQNQNGGFISSQDTAVALEAVSKFSATLPRTNTDESLIIKINANEVKHNINVSETDRLIQKKIKLPSFLTDVFFESHGKGCALVQTLLTYNTRRGRSNNDLKLHLKIQSVSDIDLYSIAKFFICVKNKSQKNKINMAVLEVAMVSGYYPDRASLFEINTSNKGVKRWEEYEDKVNFYFENLRNKKVCVQFLVVRELCVENAAPSFIKIYDYYNSQFQTTLRYNLMPECQNESWLKNHSNQIKTESKRELRYQENHFSFIHENFKHVESFENIEDLETPHDLEGIMPVYALPPNKKSNGNSKCVHCLRTIPEIFPQLYCSSALAIKILIVGKEIFEFQMDVSPRSNFTSLNNSVSFTKQEKCDCFILNSVNTFALMLVTPPRVFKVQHVFEIHLDDSIQLYPWGDSQDMPKYLTEAIKFCQKWTFNEFN